MKSSTKTKPYFDTTVSVGKSRADIDKLLSKYGVTATQWTVVDDRATLRFQFEVDGRPLMVRLTVDPRSQGDPPPRHSSAAKQEKHWRREAMRLHRTLYWGVKSRLELIESGLETPLSVWLPAIETGAQTFAERVSERVHEFAAPDYSVGGVLALPASKTSRG